jgi:hypothetical protein
MVDKDYTVDLLGDVDGDTETGVWMALSEIARLRGTSRQAISKRVKRLGLPTRPGPKGTLMVELASFDRATHQATVPSGFDGGPAMERAEYLPARHTRSIGAETPLVERTRYEAALRRLDLEERLGKVVATKQVEEAMVAAGTTIARVFERLTSSSSEIYAATRDGEPAVRQLLRRLADDMRRDAAKALAELHRQGEAEEAAGGIEMDFPSLPEERTS